VVNALYLTLLATSFGPSWLLDAAAALFAIGPLAITLASMGSVNFTLRWATVIQNIALSAFLLVFQHRPGIGVALAFNAVLFVIYFGCSINFLFAYRRATAGAFITIAGFMAWASGFVLAPRLFFAFPQIHVELEVWNLPKFLVALGMILLLLEDQIEHNKYLALHDPLTGLPNRRLFEDRMANALERAHRTGTQIALLVVDLDRFKEINDSLGHHMGDLVLERVASIFTERVRHSDTVSRTGGDEFSLILEESTNREEAEKVAASLRQLLEAPLNIEGHKAQIGASIGIAIYPEDAADAEALCIAADRRMYEAKHYTRRLSRNAPKPKRNPLPASDSSV
jgi:diguanylate cyclase (GGDEF)-like protein